MTAWAIIINGEIDLQTINGTDVGAMANWLYVVMGALHVTPTEADIRASFAAMKDQAGANVEVCPVEIRRVLQ